MDPAQARRLAFIKYLYGLGVQQSRAAEPLSALSLLTFHDAAEWLLQLACERHNIDATKASFADYWKLLTPALPPGGTLSQRPAMARLNRARVAMKHHATLAHPLDIEAFRATTTAFFHDNVPLLFGVDFDTLSMLGFVQPEPAREHLAEAERQLAAGACAAAAGQASIAFEIMLRDDERPRRQQRGNPFTDINPLLSFNPRGPGLGTASQRSEEFQRVVDFADRTKRAVESMAATLRVLGFGINYRQFMRFRQIVPPALLHGADRWEARPDPARSASPSPEDVRFCIDFVIDVALRLQRDST